MSLAEAAEALGIAPNSVRSRWKAAKIRGERDNSGKIWVWIEPAEGSKERVSKPSVEGASKPSKASIETFESGEIKALQAHVATLVEELAAARAELAILKPVAAEADRLKVRVEGLDAQIATLRELADEMKRQRDERQKPRGWLAWLKAG